MDGLEAWVGRRVYFKRTDGSFVPELDYQPGIVVRVQDGVLLVEFDQTPIGFPVPTYCSAEWVHPWTDIDDPDKIEEFLYE